MTNHTRLFSLCLIAWVFLGTTPGQGQWVSIGPDGGKIECIAQDPADSQILYGILSGSPSQFLKSTNMGDSWSVISELNHYAYALAIDPQTPSKIFVGAGRYLSISTNSGLSWSNQYHTDRDFDRLIIDDQDPDLIHANGSLSYSSNTYGHYFRSTNGGSTWSSHQISPNRLYPRCMAVDPAHPDTIYVCGYSYDGSTTYHVFKSTDAGTTWTDVIGGIGSSPYAVAVDPVNDRVYVGTTGGVYRSTNHGTSWTRNSGTAYGYSLAIDPNDPKIIYAGHSNKVYRSTNKGQNFTAYSSGLYGGICHQVLVDVGSSSKIFALNNSGFFKSTDGGQNWNESVSGYCASDIEAVRVNPHSPNILYAAFDNNAVYKTTNALGKTSSPAEVTWARLPAFYDCHNIADFEFGPQNPNVVFALEGGG